MKARRHRLSPDIISTLPPDIIETILCLLPVKEAARTSVLSQGWRYKWTKMSKLVFKVVGKNPFYEFGEGPFYEIRVEDPYRVKESPFHAIYQVLLRHQGPITEFTLSASDHAGSYFEITQIILHLSGSNTVKKLHLNFNYELPIDVFSFHKLTDLYLHRCCIRHQPTFNIGCRSLTNLHLECVDIPNETLLRLLSNCPLLKSFTLIQHYRKISSDDDTTFIKLFECLRAIENLTLGFLGIQCFGKLPLREFPNSLLDLKCICFKTMHAIEKDEYGLPFLALLIRSSPNLEKIKLQMVAPSSYDELDIDSYAMVDYSDINLDHLHELEIINFCNLKPDLEFVKTILAKSPMLKKINVQLKAKVAYKTLLKVSSLLLSFPCAAGGVKLIVERGR